MFETAAEYIEEITIIRTALRNIALTSKEYEIGSGASKRTFKQEDMNNLRSYLASLKDELRELQGNSGAQAGF